MSNPFSYAGKRVVVTGAATGVGAALLDLLAEIGAPEVTVVDIKAPSGPHARFVEANLSEEAAVTDVIAALDGPVDVLFNNAGVAATQPPRVVLAVNDLALRRLSEGLLERIPGGGAIVTRSSLSRTPTPRTRRCPAAGSRCSRGSATSLTSSAPMRSSRCSSTSLPRPRWSITTRRAFASSSSVRRRARTAAPGSRSVL